MRHDEPIELMVSSDGTPTETHIRDIHSGRIIANVVRFNVTADANANFIELNMTVMVPRMNMEVKQQKTDPLRGMLSIEDLSLGNTE